MEKVSGVLHVVVFPYPAQGHINPGLQFCQLLVSSLPLCKVTFVNTSYHIAKLKAAHLHLGPSIRLQALTDDGRHDEDPHFCEAVDGMGPLFESLLRKLLCRCRDQEGCRTYGQHDNLHTEDGRSEVVSSDDSGEWPPPIGIVSDTFLGWVQDVADRLALPRFILFTPPAATLVLMLSLPNMLLQGRLPCHNAEDEVRIQRLDLPGLTPTLCLGDVPSHLLLPPTAFMFNYFIRHSKHIPFAAGILLNTFYELESSAINAARDILGPVPPTLWADHLQKHLPHRVIPVGPLLPSRASGIGKDVAMRAGGEEDKRCLQWLERHPPSSVVYVSFGSMAELSEQQIHELAKGLESSGKAYLWVLRGQSKGYLPPGFAAHTEPNAGCLPEPDSRQGLVVSWAPQLDVLSHPSTAFFLSHCGWNSSLEAICSGVPMLGWPIFAEQKMNCRFLVDELKVATEFSKGEAGLVVKEEVERVVKEVFETEQGHIMRSRAAKWKHSAGKAVSDGGLSHENLQAFGSVLFSVHSSSNR